LVLVLKKGEGFALVPFKIQKAFLQNFHLFILFGTCTKGRASPWYPFKFKKPFYKIFIYLYFLVLVLKKRGGFTLVPFSIQKAFLQNFHLFILFGTCSDERGGLRPDTLLNVLKISYLLFGLNSKKESKS